MAEEKEDPTSVLQPLLKGIVSENFQKKSLTQIAPTFWSGFGEDMSADEALDSLLAALEYLQQFLMTSMSTVALTKCLPALKPQSHGIDGLYSMVQSSLSQSTPSFIPSLVEKVFAKSMQAWDEICQRSAEDDGVRTLDSDVPRYWDKFMQLVSQLHSLSLFNFMSAFSIATTIDSKIQQIITQQCAGIYDEVLLVKVTCSLKERLLSWLQQILGKSESTAVSWMCQMQFTSYKEFAKLRIGELFEIIVDYPDSEPALVDLKMCLQSVDMKEVLISTLKESFKRRLLHPGVNTADIITQYISAIKALLLLDPSGVMLEKICGPVREYLHDRTDTVRCIVASLTNDSESDLAEELVRGELTTYGGNADSDNENQSFSSWMPDPVDADPSSSSVTRQASDVISMLVNIYGSCEMFVAEYRNLLADRLLQSCTFDISREVCTLELLKQRFGEGSLHFCEVMLKDIADSKRINNTILSKTSKVNTHEELDLHGFVLSHEFWPSFKEEHLELPSFVQRKLDAYSKEYQGLKGLRRLVWKTHLGSVNIELNYGDHTQLSLTVSPIQATIIYHFQEQCCWSIDALSHSLKGQPSVIRKHVGFWVAQGVLRELCTDTFSIVKQRKMVRQAVEYDDDLRLDTVKDDMEADIQVYWNYITHMLTNLGSVSLERIHMMLGMFGLQGNLKKDIELNELRIFLEKKVLEQQLVCTDGYYRLAQ